MATESVENAPSPVTAPVVPPKKRGPKSKEEIRAEIEAELRAEVEASLREELAAEMRAKAQEEEKNRQAASEAKPINGLQITGDISAEGAVTIHFVDDGFTILGKIWYRGEELTVVPETSQWEESMVEFPKGSGSYKCFAELDEFEQEEKWGRRFFRPGLWRGKRLDEIDDETLTDSERAQLAKAQRLREERFGLVG